MIMNQVRIAADIAINNHSITAFYRVEIYLEGLITKITRNFRFHIPAEI